jgi:type I restriction enzyme R subunit
MGRLTVEERAEVKRVAKALFTRLKDLFVLNWRQKASARSQLRMAIEDELDLGLPRAYDPSLYQAKCSAVFEQVFEAYLDRDRGVFAKAG